MRRDVGEPACNLHETLGSARRPPEHPEARLVPRHPDVALPLEDGAIPWRG